MSENFRRISELEFARFRLVWWIKGADCFWSTIQRRREANSWPWRVLEKGLNIFKFKKGRIPWSDSNWTCRFKFGHPVDFGDLNKGYIFQSILTENARLSAARLKAEKIESKAGQQLLLSSSVRRNTDFWVKSFDIRTVTLPAAILISIVLISIMLPLQTCGR